MLGKLGPSAQKFRRVGASLLLVASLPPFGLGLRPATAQLLGPEFQVNTYTTSFQGYPAVAADAAGNFVVVWESNPQDGSYSGIFGQRFGSPGSPLASEFQVNSQTTNSQRFPTVATDGPGNFVVVWQSYTQDGSGWGVFGQRFNSVGGPVGSEFQVNTYTTENQFAPAVAVDGSGNFVVVWESSAQDGSYSGIFGQRFSSTGGPVGSEFQVNSSTTDSQSGPTVAADGSGSFVVVWESYTQDGSYFGIFGQRFGSTGSPVGSEFQVNSFTTGTQYHSAVAADGSGTFVVVWDSYIQDGSGWGAFGQQFDSLGSPVGSEFQVNAYTTQDQFATAVAADGSGNFVVAWQNLGQEGSTWGVLGQRFNSAGSPVGSEFQVNTYTTDNQFVPAVAADGSGNFVVAWQSGLQDGSQYGVFGKRVRISIFSDGFDVGDACAWSAAVGGGCP